MLCFLLLKLFGFVKQVVVADREFNIASISRAALGPGSAVLDVNSGKGACMAGRGGSGGGSEAAAECVAFVLKPAGAGGRLFRAELTTTQRLVECDGSDGTFDVLEAVRQASANGHSVLRKCPAAQ